MEVTNVVKRSDREEERQKRNKLTAAAPATMLNKTSRFLFVPTSLPPILTNKKIFVSIKDGCFVVNQPSKKKSTKCGGFKHAFYGDKDPMRRLCIFFRG